MDKTIYVVGGTNGVGKSTIRIGLLGSSIPYINADFIAKELKAGQSSLMHAELAKQYGSEQIKKHIAAGESFAFENNLHEAKTYQWLEEMQKKGYRIEIYYIGVNDLKITTTRIRERVKRGEHYVPPNEVQARFENGLKLLRHYFTMPDKLLIIDNSENSEMAFYLDSGFVQMHNEDYQWVNDLIKSVQSKETTSVKDLASIAEVRRLYETRKDKGGHN